MTASSSMGAPRRVPMDPRIRARRIEVARSEARRRLRVVLVATGTLVVLGSGYGLTRSPLLDVDAVELAGAVRTARADALAAAGLDRPRQLVDLDPGTVSRRLERLPWVADASVTRRWPGTVVLRITEREPVAVLAAGERWAEIDAEGRVLGLADRPPTGLPVLEGVEAGGVGSHLEGPAAAAAEIAAALPDGLRRTVASVRAGDAGVELALVPRGTAVLGPATEVGDKLVALQTVLAEVDPTTVELIDVRVPNAPVLTRR